MNTSAVTSRKQARELLYALQRDVKDLAEECESATPVRKREIAAELDLVERHIGALLDRLYGGNS